MPLTNQTDALGKLILRLTLGGLMLFHGVGKILNPAMLQSIAKNLTDTGLPVELSWGVYVGEIVAPLLIILGIFSRFGGLLVVINMIFALVLAHSAQVFTLAKSGGWALELQAFYLLCGLAIAFLGSGKMAVRPD